MPKYELMYIVASSISDDQIPSVTDGILKSISDLGGKNAIEEKLGKKKLAYPIKKTRNGFYDLVTFDMEDGSKLSELNQKVLNTEGIIRHLTIALDDGIRRQEKDRIAQESMNRNRSANAANMKVPAPLPGKEGAASPITDENIDAKIEEALTEDLTKI